MNDKLFSHLIMAHFLSGWWSVLGENSNDDDDTLDSKDLRVLKMVTDNPDLYKVLRDRLISLNTFKELYFNEEGENRNYYAGNFGYLKYVQGIKIRDWIVDLENKFPNWLMHLEVDRFIKWVLALKFVEGPIFDDLRNRIKKCTVLNAEEFANEMDSMFEETTSLFAGNLPGIPIPKHNEILHLCKIMSRGKEEREAACNILLSTISGDRIKVPTTSNISSSIADTYPSKFYVIITACKKMYLTDAEIVFDDVLQKVESDSEFINHNCTILENFLVNRIQTDDTQNEQKQKTTLPAVIIRIGFPINLRVTSPEERKQNKLILDSVMNSIRTDLQQIVPQSDGNIFIVYEFISHEWFRSFVNPSKKKR
ncbi:uncharacterized protein LOC135842431 isoform X1 [Planococcus citri]|uniref:uncharacterized protein LOC135842431 isoform X1 n=1 Tax=Planococcus citri TaxID=170843 RepID=UPI0031F79330